MSFNKDAKNTQQGKNNFFHLDRRKRKNEVGPLPNAIYKN